MTDEPAEGTSDTPMEVPAPPETPVDTQDITAMPTTGPRFDPDLIDHATKGRTDWDDAD
jgi:hypothetical protein